MIVKVICWITSSSITYYSGKEIPSEQRPSRKEIPFGHLRHAERLLRSPTLGQLGSSVALGLGGAHTALVSGSQRCSYRGTWSTRALRSPAAPPTATPCKAPTETPSSTTGYLLTQRMNFPSLQPADTTLLLDNQQFHHLLQWKGNSFRTAAKQKGNSFWAPPLGRMSSAARQRLHLL